MSLQFIIGGSGSGKTRRLYNDLIEQAAGNPDGRYFAIVPEQFTMQTQKDIVTLHPCHGVMNIDIVSFERLAYRIFEELAVESLSPGWRFPGFRRWQSGQWHRTWRR